MTNDLTKLLAEVVMGWEVGNIDMPHWWCIPVRPEPIPLEEEYNLVKVVKMADWNPLTNWDDCMMLVEQMEKLGFDFQYASNNVFYKRAVFRHAIKNAIGYYREYERGESGRTAICMAAAKAVGIDVE